MDESLRQDNFVLYFSVLELLSNVNGWQIGRLKYLFPQQTHNKKKDDTKQYL